MTAHTRSENQREFLFEDNYFHINILLSRTKTRSWSSYISHFGGNSGWRKWVDQLMVILDHFDVKMINRKLETGQETGHHQYFILDIYKGSKFSYIV